MIFGMITVQTTASTSNWPAVDTPALLLRADGDVQYVNTAGGQAVGMFAAAKFVSARVD